MQEKKGGLLETGQKVIEDQKELDRLWERAQNDAAAWENIPLKQRQVENVQEISMAGRMGRAFLRWYRLYRGNDGN